MLASCVCCSTREVEPLCVLIYVRLYAWLYVWPWVGAKPCAVSVPKHRLYVGVCVPCERMCVCVCVKVENTASHAHLYPSIHHQGTVLYNGIWEDGERQEQVVCSLCERWVRGTAATTLPLYPLGSTFSFSIYLSLKLHIPISLHSVCVSLWGGYTGWI